MEKNKLELEDLTPEEIVKVIEFISYMRQLKKKMVNLFDLL